MEDILLSYLNFRASMERTDDLLRSPIKFTGNTLLYYFSFGYLGTILSRNCKDDDDILSRIKTTENAFGALRKYFFSNMSMKV